MRRPSGVVHRRWTIGLVLVAAVLPASCGDSAGTTAGSPAISPGTRISPGAAVSPGGSVGSGESGAAAGADPRDGAEPSPAVARCTAAGLAASLDAAPAEGTGQQQLHVIFANRSAAGCALYGHPGAQLRSATGDTWDLVRSTLVNPTRVVLAPGERAHATLAYLPTDPGDGTGNPVFAPVTLVLTPPDERDSLSVPWTRGPVLRQDGATHPGTYISAFEPGA
ncbi:DUF4232 domain-containing protein [Parafrankia sp. BMG5.11]|uniref:DUF4232 domain-containing protein n=1 Tax=Parafrankia sp. BMG5.11 TaxID=222540 RepID=UPI00103DA44D|nr:DUF4232 domain-containing protein [Parafrankia sp. BMG5.11]TCJ36647.1 DUF4232 domain-containing protein [Parafrankia sp. BMG5.11]